MVNKDAGFNGEQIVVVKMNERENKFQKYKLAKQLLVKHPNITDVTTSLFVPGGEYINGTGLHYKDKAITIATNFSDFNYIDFAGIEIIKGRDFDQKFAQDTIKNIIINEATAKVLGIYDDPLEKKLNLGWGEAGENMNVIGVVKDYHINGFDSNIYPMMFANFDAFDFTQNWMGNVQLKIKAENISETIAYLENYWKENVEIGYPFEYEFLDKKFAKTYEKYKKQQSMFLILSIIVIVISLLGLFALATLTIQQRLKEVAIRKTLGASVREIVTQLVKSFLKVTAIALLFLLPISFYFMQNWLDNFVYRIDMPIWPYIVAPIILLFLVFSVVGIKAFNATKVDLIKYLKFE
jgi:putative ABC transport system permease protein